MNRIDEIFRKIESVPDFAGHTIDSVHYCNGYGDTPLHIVSSWGDTEAIELFVASGADINAQGETGFTPLHCAAEQNKPQAIKLLMSLGAKQFQDSNGDLPIELATTLDNSEAKNALQKSI